jgi:hypothetical protein
MYTKKELFHHNFLLIKKRRSAIISIEEVRLMANNNSNSKTQFDNMKYEIAGQLGINLKQGYNGDLTSREAGTIGGNIVKKVFQTYTGNQYPQYDTTNNKQSK